MSARLTGGCAPDRDFADSSSQGRAGSSPRRPRACPQPRPRPRPYWTSGLVTRRAAGSPPPRRSSAGPERSCIRGPPRSGRREREHRHGPACPQVPITPQPVKKSRLGSARRRIGLKCLARFVVSLRGRGAYAARPERPTYRRSAASAKWGYSPRGDATARPIPVASVTAFMMKEPSPTSCFGLSAIGSDPSAAVAQEHDGEGSGSKDLPLHQALDP